MWLVETKTAFKCSTWGWWFPYFLDCTVVDCGKSSCCGLLHSVWVWVWVSVCVWVCHCVCVCGCVIVSLCVCVLVAQSCLFATPRIVALQASLSMDFSKQEYWSGLPFLSLEPLPDPGIEPWSPASQADSLLFELQGSPPALLTEHTSTLLMPLILAMH